MSQVSKIDEWWRQTNGTADACSTCRVDNSGNMYICSWHRARLGNLLSAILEVKPDKFLATKPPRVYSDEVPYSKLANTAHGAGYNTALDEWEQAIKELFLGEYNDA